MIPIYTDNDIFTLHQLLSEISPEINKYYYEFNQTTEMLSQVIRRPHGKDIVSFLLKLLFRENNYESKKKKGILHNKVFFMNIYLSVTYFRICGWMTLIKKNQLFTCRN